MTFREVWEWIDAAPWVIDALVIWLAVAWLLGIVVGKFIEVGNADGGKE